MVSVGFSGGKYTQISHTGFTNNQLSLHDMADNYLERRYSEYLERKAASEKARQAAWKKRLDAYRKKIKQDGKKTDGLKE